MKVIVLCHLHMPLYFIGTFTEYPKIATWVRIGSCRYCFYLNRKSGLKFRSEMESYFWEVILCHLKHIIRVS